MGPKKFNRLLHNIKYNKAALGEIYKEYFPQIDLHLKRKFGESFPHEDIAHEVFVTLMTGNNFPDIEAPATWLYKMADNKALDKLKTKRFEIKLTENIADSFFLDDLISEEDVKKSLQNLDQQSQIIIYLHHWEGYNYKEIAKLINTSCNNVRVKVSRAYSVLKKFL